ncbi:MAG: hypothetical protein QXR15_03590, partial [Candidatus Hadarchaeales archaeon]
SESVLIMAKKGEFVISAEGKKGSSELRLKEGDAALTKLDVKQNTSAKFELEYLLKMVKGASSSDEIILKLGTDLPLEMEMKLEKGKLRFFLAPLIEA